MRFQRLLCTRQEPHLIQMKRLQCHTSQRDMRRMNGIKRTSEQSNLSHTFALSPLPIRIPGRHPSLCLGTLFEIWSRGSRKRFYRKRSHILRCNSHFALRRCRSPEDIPEGKRKQQHSCHD